MTPRTTAHKTLLTLPRRGLYLAALVWAASATQPLAAQQTVEGQVINGTTNQPGTNQLVQLLLVGAGMREVAAIKTDAAGRFALVPGGDIAGPFFMVQTVYEGVNYRARVEERGPTKLTVYEATSSALPLRIKSARIVVEAQGTKARVQEFFAIENLSHPPQTFSNSDGTFHFRLGRGAGDPSAAVLGQMNMPIPQGIMDGKSPGEFLINRALEPGLTVVMVSYNQDYSSEGLTLADSVEYPIARAELQVSPNNLSVESSLFKPASVDADTKMLKFQAEDLAGGATLEARVSGEAAPGAPAETTGGDGEILTTPTSMTRLGVLLLICMLLVLCWGLGVRVAKEWSRSQEQGPQSAAQKQLEAKVDGLLNSMADLDELRESGKIPVKAYWKERLELKAKVVAMLKQSPPTFLESYATRRNPR